MKFIYVTRTTDKKMIAIHRDHIQSIYPSYKPEDNNLTIIDFGSDDYVTVVESGKDVIEKLENNYHLYKH
jgi:hypothetical protein